MENSMNSMKNLMITSSSHQKTEYNNNNNNNLNNNNNNNNDNNSPEESSWTFYIQDFLCEHGNPNDNSLSYSSCNEMSDSLLSDAGSSAVKIANYQKDGGLNVNYEIISKRNMKKNSFRKRKVIQGAHAMDDDLEDTASSPVNSPKVSYMKDFEMKQKEFPNVYLEEVERKNSSSTSSRDGVGGDSGNNNDITELKKRGLCLVPLSNVANYLSY